MNVRNMNRRSLLHAGGLAVAGAWTATAQTRNDHPSSTEATVRRWYKAWEQKDWAPLDALLADDFTFTSANNDDHISKSAFKANCWQTQINFIHHFDIESLADRGDEAFVKYLCHTTNGKSFRNVEYIRVEDGKLKSIECYFGELSSFPSAVSLKK